ncbi:uncharacterized protein LOC107428058 isoform X4 [Ziziphus jujuba]|uniref:Uncharacterized protein LOC107428058 isoform X4 n=1 Tax=Ziziphus jujuba TaxID=326968 RepID=A0ABM3ZYI8_ZIZJJ|nr:uncharacterized protein LOC107428058 isoform X4 [Ziziphus jujuba]
MGELHSLAYTSGSSLHNSSQGWDFHHNLGILNTDTMSLVMDGSNASFLSSLDSDFSTGYLEDALVEFSEQSKRRRLMLYTEDDHQIRDSSTTTTFLDVKDYWNSSNWELSENFNCMMTQMTGFDTLSGWELEHERKKKRVIKRVVYPFAVVKPGGKEGDVTLNDINERIMMPPTRPVRHPVGDFACRPCVSPDGPGLSGKAVVALTKIHTQGRGTITIIRTKG